MDAKYYDSIRRYQKAHGSITLPFYEKKMTTQQADVISFEKYKKNRKFTHKADAYATIERLENRERIKKRREEKEERKKHNDKVLKSLGRK